MQARVLRPSLWFGLLEHRKESIAANQYAPTRQYYRKTTLFDRLLTFDVEMELQEARH
jgi:hypothetical protein